MLQRPIIKVSKCSVGKTIWSFNLHEERFVISFHLPTAHTDRHTVVVKQGSDFHHEQRLAQNTAERKSESVNIHLFNTQKNQIMFIRSKNFLKILLCIQFILKILTLSKDIPRDNDYDNMTNNFGLKFHFGFQTRFILVQTTANGFN